MDLKLLSSVFLAFYAIENCYAQDSTQLSLGNLKPLKPKTVINPNKCIEAKAVSAKFNVGYGKTGHGYQPDWVQSNCPEGFQPYGLKSFVLINEGNGIFKWQYYCCKTKVIYTN